MGATRRTWRGQRTARRPPRHGWVCWHCGYVARTWIQARDHFGSRPGMTPGCSITPRRMRLFHYWERQFRK